MSIKKYKRGDRLFYTPDGWPNSLECEVLISTLEPGGVNLESATVIIKAKKMGHPITIPILDQDDYLSEVSIPATVKKQSLLSRLFGVFTVILLFAPAANTQTVSDVFSPRIKSEYRAAQQEPEKTKFRVASAILPLATGIGAGACADTEAGKAGRDAFLYGAAVSISFGRKKPFLHYLINSGVSFAGFFIGRGIREVSE